MLLIRVSKVYNQQFQRTILLMAFDFQGLNFVGTSLQYNTPLKNRLVRVGRIILEF